jgi:hypothetical protein
MSDTQPPSPVWAPMPDWPLAYVPKALGGLRSWDKNGPEQVALLAPPWSWAIYRRAGSRLVCIKGVRQP